jgi:predicted methyltransferase
MRFRTMIAASLLLCVAAPSCGQAPAPDLAAAIAAPDRSNGMRELDASRKPAEVLQFLGLKRGDRALDLFGSNAYWGLILARSVGPQGSVDSWEAANFVDAKTNESWDQRHNNVPNLQLIVSPAAAIQLPENTYDFVMFNQDYHDLYWESAEYKFPRMDPKPFVGALFRSMKAGGILGVIDHVANPGGDTRKVAQALHRIDPATLRSDFEAAGFVFEAESPLLRNPADDHQKNVFDPSIRLHTDRIVYRFRKPA